MRMKAVIIFFILYSLLIAAFAYIFFRKYYLQYNLLRLDPLEVNKLNQDVPGETLNAFDIWMIGDSRIARWDQNLISLPDHRILNLGIDGQTTTQVLERLKEYLKVAIPRKIIFEAGINDLKIIGLKKNLQPEIELMCYNNITSVVNICRDRQIKIITMNIIPPGRMNIVRGLFWNNSVRESISKINSLLKAFCDSKNTFYYDSDKILCDRDSIIKREYRGDFLHLNKEGYKALSTDISRHAVFLEP